ncbi:hypothetical protein DYQ86_20540 [Acidobacteria bacterium AB60]|nr:hypothetical protein DYQ86_20540 [Acidobacteria bacterium AB60]
MEVREIMCRFISHLSLNATTVCVLTIVLLAFAGCSGVVLTPDAAAKRHLVITSTSLGIATVSNNYQQTLTATGGTPPYSWSLVSGSLPAGLSLTNSGTISGVPTRVGSAPFAVEVADSSAVSASAALSITVDASDLEITTESLPSGTECVAYSQALAATGGTPPYKWSISSGSLPAGIMLSSGGTLSGTPTAAGTAGFSVEVTDSASVAKSANFSLTISSCGTSPLTITTKSLPQGSVGTAYLQVFQAGGGATPYTWTRTGGALPAGLSLASNGTISGTPTASGISTFAVQVTDAKSATTSATLSITIAAGLTITTTTLPEASTGVPYQDSLTASGGTSPYTWKVNSGSLPTGLSLSGSGIISGTPAATGSSKFTVQVADAASATRSATLTLAVSSLRITTTSLASGIVGTAYQTSLAATGGTAPYTWSMVSGALPAGLSLAGNGTISGTPKAAGSPSFTVRATDSTFATQTASFTLTVTGTLAITTTSLPAGTVGAAYQSSLAASGGTPPYAWSLASGSLPAGLSLASSGAVTGTPTTSGSSSFNVQVKDSLAAQKTSGLTLTVNAVSSFSYVFGTTLYPYSTQAPIAKGQTYTDPTFHVPVTRVSNATSDLGVWGMSVNYATWNPLSSDRKYLALAPCSSVTDCGSVALYDPQTYAYVSTVPDTFLQSANNGQDPEPRWDYSGTHPSWLYYRSNKQLRYVDTTDMSDHLVHDFTADFPSVPSTDYILNGQEGSPSSDSRYWAFMFYSTPLVFVYDRVTDAVVSSHSTTGAVNGINNVMMSPSGNYVYVAYTWTGRGDEFDGPHVYARNFGSNCKTASDVPHGNWAWTRQGHEVFFSDDPGTDAIHYVRGDNCAYYDVYDDAGDGYTSHLFAHHDQLGWGMMSTYGLPAVGSLTDPTAWAYSQILGFELDETKCVSWAASRDAWMSSPQSCSGGQTNRIWRIAWAQNKADGANYYFEQPNAAMDYAGTHIWFGANWRTENGNMDVYQVDLPPTWVTDLAK